MNVLQSFKIVFVPGEDESEVELQANSFAYTTRVRKLTKLKVKMKRKEKNEKVERLSIEHKAMSPSVQVKLIPVYSRTVVFIVLGCLFAICA